MAKAEWGTKRTCQNCGARFYDLHRDPIRCPVCSAVYDPDRHPRPRRGTGGAKPETAAAARFVETALAEEDLEPEAADKEMGETDAEDVVDGEEGNEGDVDDLDADEDRDLIEDTSDLGEDDDDIGEVIEHIDEDVHDKG